MKLVGLTGGIGSGKSYVARHFEDLGIPVYYADKEAKRLMNFSPELKTQLKDLLGKGCYHRNGRLNRPFVAKAIFSNKAMLKKVNGLVHPAVQKDFFLWAGEQRASYVVEESAIIFENSLQERFDRVILVTAAKETRISRVMARDNCSREAVISRMKKQFTDKKKIPLADFIITNDGEANVKVQVKAIDKKLKQAK